MNALSKAAILLLVVLTAAACQKGSAAGAPKPASHAAAVSPGPIPLGMLPRTVVPQHYRLAFIIDPTKDRFSGHTEIDVQVSKPVGAFYMHGLDLRVGKLVARTAAGKSIAGTYKQVDDSGVALVTFASPLPAGGAMLVFDYDAPFGQSLAGLYKVVDAGDAYAFTQFEDIDARRAYPSFDEPGFKTPFDISITAPAGDKVIANTPETSVSPVFNNGMQKHVFLRTMPLPT
ncbi:MAG TPA: hypothetical protein VLV55_11615, partial [Rhizomicrobium sp.]|nr:hypothetical protein [Rhizomicrobium sp.]